MLVHASPEHRRRVYLELARERIKASSGVMRLAPMGPKTSIVLFPFGSMG